MPVKLAVCLTQPEVPRGQKETVGIRPVALDEPGPRGRMAEHPKKSYPTEPHEEEKKELAAVAHSKRISMPTQFVPLAGDNDPDVPTGEESKTFEKASVCRTCE